MNVVDLFCGCGGLSAGFEKAGANILLGIDQDKAALKSFQLNHDDSKVICGDIEKVSIDEIDRAIDGKKVDVVIGGPPCQGLSLSGPRRYDDPRNRLFLSFVRIAKHLSPSIIVLENVPGILSLFKGEVKDRILEEFSEIGYELKYRVLNAADYGVPQVRKRAIFIGVKKNSNLNIEFPEPFLSEVNYITCSEALSDLDELDEVLMPESNDYKTQPVNEYQKMMRVGMKDGRLTNHLITKHQDKVKATIALVPEGGNYKDLPENLRGTRKFNVAWTRYHSKKPASTIDTGHRHHFHYKLNRVPTVRENARLQSFPDTFIFEGNKTEQYRQVGNAVPPLLGYAIALKIKENI
ncbi:DNA cytosine methyltransferase (plasmid) [Photobacterium damselae subsp. damselae]|uniref:DNA cytosine methyltransferase n=1 Tax=Photobacterium damselae TaxID=38293 RepID=UPI002F7473B3